MIRLSSLITANKNYSWINQLGFMEPKQVEILRKQPGKARVQNYLYDPSLQWLSLVYLVHGFTLMYISLIFILTFFLFYFFLRKKDNLLLFCCLCWWIIWVLQLQATATWLQCASSIDWLEKWTRLFKLHLHNQGDEAAAVIPQFYPPLWFASPCACLGLM